MDNKILLICGSRGDLTKENKEKIESAFGKREGMVHEIETVSADRVPEFLAPTINEHRPDGIICFGAYSLVLASAAVNAHDMLTRYPHINDPRKAMRDFFESGDLSMKPPFDTYNIAISTHYGDRAFIPLITVPMHDSVSEGAYAFTSVTGQPSVMHPRPAVGLGNFEAAVNVMHMALNERYKGVDMYTTFIEGLDEGTMRVSDKTQEGAEKIKGILGKELGIQLVQSGEKFDPSNINISVIDLGVPSALRDMDGKSALYIAVPPKAKTNIEQYLGLIGSCNNGLFLGPGSYENAAILAAQILTLSLPKAEREALEGRINTYINTKTADSIFGFKR